MDKSTVEFAEMALALHDEPDTEHTLERIADYARTALASDEAGIMMLRGNNHVETATASSKIVEEADRLQMELAQGPCVDAIWNGDAFVIVDTATDPRWPTWGPKVADLGLRSILSLRLFTRSTTLGALNLYSFEPDRFDEDDQDIADIFARHASIALATAHEEDGLRHAIGARHLIGQAQGILMEQLGIDADKAFSVLKRYSRDNNVKLRIVARHVISTKRLPDQA